MRRAGVLLHPTSLPGPGRSGVIGADARRFADWLAGAGFSVWQTLPLGPVGISRSPYQVYSAFAGDPQLIDPSELNAAAAGIAASADGMAQAWPAFRVHASHAERAAFSAYWQTQRHWLLPWTLFCLCRERHGSDGWWTWPADVRRRQPLAIATLLESGRDRLREFAFLQYLFDAQWSALRAHARKLGLLLFGDLPIYVDLDSADVWWHRRLFRVDEEGVAAAVAGVPPDYFSDEGQVWGNPLYDWDRLQAEGFRWWVDRVRHQLLRFDLLRLDHFRGLESYWEVPTGAETARDGHWRPAPGKQLLEALTSALGKLPLVAEDLGVITDKVRTLRDEAGLPGMLVLQFAFDGDADNPYLPPNHPLNAAVYSGTHDNDTLAGWWQSLPGETRQLVMQSLGCGPEAMPAALVDAVWGSRARLAMVPLQDLLALGAGARMNIPGTSSGNWGWRFSWEQLPHGLAATCRAALAAAGRLPAVQERPDTRLYSAS